MEYKRALQPGKLRIIEMKLQHGGIMSRNVWFNKNSLSMYRGYFSTDDSIIYCAQATKIRACEWCGIICHK